VTIGEAGRLPARLRLLRVLPRACVVGCVPIRLCPVDCSHAVPVVGVHRRA
jgi:hypothetical protein